MADAARLAEAAGEERRLTNEDLKEEGGMRQAVGKRKKRTHGCNDAFSRQTVWLGSFEPCAFWAPCFPCVLGIGQVFPTLHIDTHN